MMDVVVFPCKGKPYKESVTGDLKSLQNLVGGLIEPIALPNEYGKGNLTEMLRLLGVKVRKPLALVNEEGLLHGMGRNQWFPEFVGPVVVMERSSLK